MVDLQVESDQRDEHWLTCVLFPQGGPQSAFDGEPASIALSAGLIHYIIHRFRLRLSIRFIYGSY